MTPKIIHQIWYQGVDKIPQNLQNNSNKIINLHKNWKYMIWDNNSIKKYFKNNHRILTTYNKLKYLHQKVDFMKYCILYNFGGVYMDMDINALKSLDQLVKQYENYECILSGINLNVMESYALCRNNKCINNGIIISQQKSNFMLALINEICKNNKCQIYDLNKSICINRTTGPLLITKIYNNYENKSQIKILHYSYFEPCVLGDICDIKKNTILIHTHNTTWINTQITKFLYYYFKYKLIIYLAIYLILIIIVIQISHYIMCYIKK